MSVFLFYFTWLHNMAFLENINWNISWKYNEFFLTILNQHEYKQYISRTWHIYF